MEINVKTMDQVSVATLTGEIDGKTAPVVQEQLLPLTKTAPVLLLDLSGVPFMSSAGLRMLLLLYRQSTTNKTQIALAGVSEDIKDTMEATGFLNYFKLFDSVDSALATLSPRGAA